MINFSVKNEEVSFDISSNTLEFNVSDESLVFKTGDTAEKQFSFEENAAEFETDLSYSSGASVPAYHGAYTVIPSSSQQVLDTGGYRMIDDVTVEEIPYSEVSNTSGGLTVNIGG